MYGYIGTFITYLLKFLSRTVFIYTIGVNYLGINGLYTNILTVLSFAELGIGTAMNYSLYKPVAENNKEKIKSFMSLFKVAYRWVAFVVAIIGLSFLPFLENIIKDAGGISSKELIFYYLIFLFNTVSSYFVSYKYSLVNADQKNYIQTNINTITMIIITILQIIVLIIFKSFLFYLIVAALVELIQKIFANHYINKKYPYLLEGNVKKLAEDELKELKKNIKALILHKVGDISVHQTDNIIISAFINLKTVGLISNYNLIINSVTSFINIIFNSTISSFGNLVATENVEKQNYLFNVYRFIGFWFYGFASIAFLILINPFIALWIGNDMLVPNIVIYLILFDYYLKGHRIVVNNFKIAAGVFNPDKYIGLIQAIVNLVLSIYLVKRIGLPGIYIGTVVQGLIATFTKPYIVYKYVFRKKVIEYYKDSLKYIITLFISIITLEFIINNYSFENNIINFIFMFILVLLIPNLIFYITFRKRSEFKYLMKIIKSKVKKVQ
jgi:O-antigen/teichoic acid export membrane protein